ncbi:MAG: hypothetical protein L6Q76_34215, partial [Polyangiaceae bacterium]|nr:hypothetical protein [Polyangiaceae bacterium]
MSVSNSWIGRSRRLQALKLAALVLSIAVALPAVFGGCGLLTAGTGTNAGTTACETAAHCDDGNPCTRDSCGADGLCAVEPVDGEPLAQVIGDCLVISCAAGEPMTAPDPSDVDDGNSCTSDVCKNGQPVHTDLEGTACLLEGGEGVCKAGQCVMSCSTADDPCDDMNPCTEDGCDVETGLCVHDAAKLHGTLLSDVGEDDCTEERCVNGQSMVVADDTEVPAPDANDCDEEVCSGGVIVKMNEPLDAPCGTQGGLYCDGDGNCVGCTAADQCTSGECTDPTCVNETCGTVNTASGVPCTTGYCKGNGACVECVADANCSLAASEVCASDTCVVSCPDMAKNGAETDVDCGGSVCPKCADLEGCGVANDCLS